MSTDLVKEARGKRKNNVQEKPFINTPVVLQINFPILGYESKGTPWDFAEKAPFYGSLTVSWSPSGQNNVKVEKFYQKVERLDSFCSWNQITIKFGYSSG